MQSGFFPRIQILSSKLGRVKGALLLCFVGSIILDLASLAQGDPDLGFRYENEKPTFNSGEGPCVCFDEAHNNYHLSSDVYEPFKVLLNDDGYVTKTINQEISLKSIRDCDIFIIPTPVHKKNRSDWSLPHHSAFSKSEIQNLYQWVNDGGGLFLILDHNPIPGAMNDLTTFFGLAIFNGEARNVPSKRLPDQFSFDNGGLKRHPITRGLNPNQSISSIATWTGTAFKASREFSPIMIYGRGARMWVELNKTVPNLKADRNPVFDIEGWLLAASRELGAGRLLVLGEAAMCTATVGKSGKKGMNTKAGAENPRFLLNSILWLSGERH